MEAFEVHSSKDMVYRLAPGLQVRVRALHPPLDSEFFWDKPTAMSDRIDGPDRGPPASPLPMQDIPEFAPDDGDHSNAESDGDDDDVGNNEVAPQVDGEDSGMDSQTDSLWPIEEGSHDEAHESGGSHDDGSSPAYPEGPSQAGPGDDALDHGARGRGRGRAARGRAAATVQGADLATALQFFLENVPFVGAASASQRFGEAMHRSALV